MSFQCTSNPVQNSGYLCISGLRLTTSGVQIGLYIDDTRVPTRFFASTINERSILQKGKKVNPTVHSLARKELLLQNVLCIHNLPVDPN